MTETVSHGVSHATPAEQLKFLTDEARKALAIFNRLPMQEYFRRNAENDVLALAIEQASDHIATALNILSAQPTTYEFDPYGEAEQAGMQFALRLFARQIAGVAAWEGGDGSETVDGDVMAEFQNIAKAAGWVDEHGDAQFGQLNTLQRPQGSAVTSADQPCPICNREGFIGLEGCDHTKPERDRASAHSSTNRDTEQLIKPHRPGAPDLAPQQEK